MVIQIKINTVKPVRVDFLFKRNFISMSCGSEMLETAQNVTRYYFFKRSKTTTVEINLQIRFTK